VLCNHQTVVSYAAAGSRKNNAFSSGRAVRADGGAFTHSQALPMVT
jgi:hypothetical protein